VQFRELLPRRRMVRHYRSEPVPREVVERIVGTVRRAPSAGYSQGQRLLVITEEDGRAEIARIMGETGWTAPDGRELWLESAPVHILVCTREADYHDRYRLPDKLVEGEEIDWPVPFWFVDAGAALMLLLLAAVDEGLAAGVSGVECEAAKKVRSTFGIPDDVTIIALVTNGYPAPDPGWSAVTSRRTQPRRPPADIVRWERWYGADESDLTVDSSAHGKTLQTLRVLGVDLDAIDTGAAGTLAAERDQALDPLGLALEDCLDGPVPVVAHPTCDAGALGAPLHGVAKEDAVHESVDDHSPPHHAAMIAARAGSRAS